MIPKKIHYVWLSKGSYSPAAQHCIDSWKKFMPDYEIKCWNTDNFDVNSVPWVKEAVERKKWAFATDYIRHYALYTEGGIYMDSDVEVYRPFDKFLSCNEYFTSIEFHPHIWKEEGIGQVDSDGRRRKEYSHIAGLGIQAACLAACKGHPYTRQCLDYYESHRFIDEQGNMQMDIIAPAIMAQLLEKLGFRYADEEQHFDNGITIYDSSVFAGDPQTRTKASYSMHWSDNSWNDDLTLKQRIYRWLERTFPSKYRK